MSIQIIFPILACVRVCVKARFSDWHSTSNGCSILLPITVLGHCLCITLHYRKSLFDGRLSLLSIHVSLERTYSLQKNMAVA